MLKRQLVCLWPLIVLLVGCWTHAVVGAELVRTDFRRDIEPLLSRYGCNSGGCHGKASGQNGFRLSLFGFDDRYDYDEIVRRSKGRRVNLSAPEESLLLLKATGQLPHGGGKRFEVDSPAYQSLRDWIAAGSPAADPNAPHVESLTVEPRQAVMQPGQSVALHVTARYSDGTQIDVTAQSLFSSNLDVVAAVNEEGLVQAGQERGEAAVMARYMGQVAIFYAVLPHGPPSSEIPGWTPRNFIDELVAKKWQQLGLKPSPDCDDATFIRRLTIDLCGRLPTAEEVRSFLADASVDKRQTLIDRLLDSPDYPAYFATRWGSILRNSNLAGSDRAAYAFHNWLRDMLAQNRPYDELVRGVVAASGEWQDAPAINWYWQSRDDQLHTVTADTAQLFLGLRLQCARCHHHPYERWSQEDYFGLAGFFTRVGRKSFGEPPPYFAAAQVTTGERNPLTGKTPEPKYLDGDYAKFTADEDPRHGLVDWMVQPDNPFFARTLVNRYWGHFFGRGIVHEVDDMRESNPPSNPELLDALARDFAEHHFDMKHLIRTIVSSRAYQLSSEPTDDNRHDRQNFARYYARRLVAEVMADAVDQATGTKTRYGNMSADGRAIDLPHENFGSYFLDTFDRPRRVTSCECERSSGATLAQVLLLANSDEIENKLADGQGRIAKLVQAKAATDDAIDEIYLATIARYPTDEQRRVTRAYVDGVAADQRQSALEDVMWSLLNAKEFSFNH